MLSDLRQINGTKPFLPVYMIDFVTFQPFPAVFTIFKAHLIANLKTPTHFSENYLIYLYALFTL